MRETRIFRIALPGRFRPALVCAGKKPGRPGASLCCYIVSIGIISILISGCGHFNEEIKSRAILEEANTFFSQGNYAASLDKYEQIIEKYPATEDRILFEMGIIHAHPKNEHKDYQKAHTCFQKIVNDYPESGFRQDSEMMLFYIDNVIAKDMTISAQQTQIGNLQQEVAGKEHEVATLQKKIVTLEQKFFDFVLQYGSVDKILIEKSERRLTLLSKGEVLKTYKIALGGNPVGPKERQGDNKTPEGIYVIDSRNKDSQYHLSLHISYPNEKDKKRAQDLGVSPGGDIMIHGIKNGFAWVGDAHAEVDWTKGCIAVTDEEIEEIEKLVPNGTVVEIRP